MDLPGFLRKYPTKRYFSILDLDLNENGYARAKLNRKIRDFKLLSRFEYNVINNKRKPT